MATGSNRYEFTPATYSTVGVPGFAHGNPLAEAIVPLPTDTSLFDALSKKPIGDFINQPPSIQDAIAQLHTLTYAHYPRPEAILLGGRINSIIYNLLSQKNPFHPSRFNRLASISQSNFGNPISRGQPSPMLFVVGDSGMGKTTLIRGILNLIPSVITHSSYRDIPFSQLQVPVLTVDAPQGGAISGLCLALAEQLDGILQLSDGLSYRKSLHRQSIESQKVILSRAMASHCVSIIHIDDLQRISERGPGAQSEAAATIIGLANSVGALLLVSGTHEARAIFEKSFEADRRAMSLGAFELNAPQDINDPFYRALLNFLFSRQLQNHKTVLTEDLVETILNLTAGNTSITLSLYVACQEACLYHDMAMDAALFRRIRNEQFAPLVPELERMNLRRRRTASRSARGSR
ncbi:ATP-binding protein [Hydrogenophaga sp.]|uniref:ATP-binding protein n=1 Tax=Hydrogenophaga sp. TaxID=1904254 RepID=UPI00391D9F69